MEFHLFLCEFSSGSGCFYLVLGVFIGFWMFPYVSVEFFVFPAVSICFHVFPSVSLSFHLFSMFPSASLCFHLFLYVSIGFSMIPSVSLWFHLFLYVSFCFPVCPSVSLCVHLFRCVYSIQCNNVLFQCLSSKNSQADFNSLKHGFSSGANIWKYIWNQDKKNLSKINKI